MSLKIYRYKKIKDKDLRRIINRCADNYDRLADDIKQKMTEVKKYGDLAILNKYKKRKIPISSLLVSDAEFRQARNKVSANFMVALKQVIKNISIVNKAQLNNILKEKVTNVSGRNIMVWRSWKPIEKIGVYVPGGNANYPSSLLMCALPAKIAGCKEIIACCPPDMNGNLPNEVIVAAQILGVKKLYKIGGPQAVAAMAYGTQTIDKVQKIVGPGNEYVTVAKLLVYPKTTIDMPAGPSENLIIADNTAIPAFVAADLITDCEHGVDSTGVLLTTSYVLARKVNKEIDRQLIKLSTSGVIKRALVSYGGIILFDKSSEMINFANDYAPEHIQIMAKNARSMCQRIVNAGSVFIGPWTCKSSGDYATGANHVLPTGQMAKTFGPLSVENFGKLVQYQKVTKDGLVSLKNAITTFSEVEKLPAHKNSVMVRIKN